MHRAAVLAALAALAALLPPRPAAAHGNDLSYLELAVTGSRVEVRLDLSRAEVSERFPGGGEWPGPSAERNALVERGLARWLVGAVRLVAGETVCTGSPGPVELQGELVVVLRATYECGRVVEQLDLYSRVLDLLGRDHVTFARIERGGLVHQALLTASDSHAAFDLRQGGALHAARDFVLLGMEHIFTGYDHLLFLLSLLFLGGITVRRVLLIATSFTLAHSVTLTLAALGVLTLPDRLVESAIAASIAWVAVENWRYAREPAAGAPEPFAVRYRWALTFAFGLVHGFGFAGALSERQLPTQHLAVALGSFNLGVEVGQVLVLAAAFPLLAGARRFAWYRPHGVRAASLGIFGLAVYWFLLRALPAGGLA